MGRIYYLLSSGTLKRKENTLLFENERVRKVIPIEDVEEIFIFGEISLNTKLLSLTSSKGITLHFFNYYGWYIGSFYPRERNVSGFLEVKQAEHYLDKDKRLYLAKMFVIGAIKNSKFLVHNVDDYVHKVESSNGINELMSIEANFKKVYYESLKENTGWEFERRTKRPPENPLNALISFGNSLVYSVVLKQIYTTQLSPQISFLHEPSERRFSLALDISEIFKPVISDRIIKKLINTSSITEDHFVKDLNFVYLNDEGRRIFLKAFDERLRTTIRHRKLNRKISIKNLIKIECYKLIKHLLGEERYRPTVIN